MKMWTVAAMLLASVSSLQAQTVIMHAVISPPIRVYSNMMFGASAALSTNLLGGSVSHAYGGAALEGGYGLLRARTWLDTVASNPPASFSSQGTAQWVDTITVNPPAHLVGTSATLGVQFFLMGTGFAYAVGGYTAESRCEFTLRLNNASFGPLTGRWNSVTGFSGFYGTGRTNWAVPITLGQPFEMYSRVFLRVNYTRSNTSGYANAFADFSRSAQWFSISEITGDFGTLTNFTITSVSSNDWLSVPLQPLPLLEDGGMATNGQVLILNGLSIAFTNILEGAASMDSTNWSPIAEYVDASGQTNRVVNVESNTVQFFRIRQE